MKNSSFAYSVVNGAFYLTRVAGCSWIITGGGSINKSPLWNRCLYKGPYLIPCNISCYSPK